jgi:methylmalonic aciduria homocystinuria type C protein
LDLLFPRSLEALRNECSAFEIELAREPFGMLVGNTRAMWPKFLLAVRSQPALQRAKDPLDTWVEERITGAVARWGRGASIYYAHQPLGRGYLPLQRWAQILGALALSPSHLSVHCDYGPWVALRALVIFDTECDVVSAARPVHEPCSNCAAPCRALFERAARRSNETVGVERVVGYWQDWLAVRDACPVGTEFRYGEDQIRYHYCRDRSVLGAIPSDSESSDG